MLQHHRRNSIRRRRRYSQAVRQQQRNRIEAKNLGDQAAANEQFQEQLESVRRLFSLLPDQAKFEASSENHAVLVNIGEELRRVFDDSERHWDALSEITAVLQKTVVNAQMSLQSAHLKQAATHAELTRQNESANAQVLAHAHLEEEIRKLDQIEQDLLTVHTDIRQLEAERLRLKGEYLLAQEAISELRESVAELLAEETGPNVQVTVVRNADNLEYQQILMDGLRGARVRNHDEYLAKLMTIRPEDPAQMVQQQDAGSFEQFMGFGRSGQSVFSRHLERVSIHSHWRLLILMIGYALS